MSLHFDDPIDVHLPHETVRAVVSPELDRGETAVLLVRLPEPSRTLVFLLALTGLRIGELLALRWRNVDLVTGLLRVEETVYESHFDEPKSRHSVRLIPLGPLAVQVLGGLQRSGDSNALVFVSRNGTTLDRRTLLSPQLKPAAKAYGLGKVNWHLLRHSNATLHDSLGTPIGTVQALLGHSSSEITRQIYLHSLPEDRRVAAEKLEAHLFGPKLDPSFSPERNLLPEFVANEENGRGDWI